MFNEESYPALYIASDKTSIEMQKKFFGLLTLYLAILVIASLCSYYLPTDWIGSLISATLFLISLGILIWLKFENPDEIYYNGRAVAESVKTRTWRWMMQAHPYNSETISERIEKEFISDLKSILNQNRALSGYLIHNVEVGETITEEMRKIRSLSLKERIKVYKTERISNQSSWYSKKSILNKRRAKQWFSASVILHSLAILMLLYRIRDPLINLPIEVVATSASAVLTWLQAKKHNELKSSYSLAAHEIVLIKGEAESIFTEKDFSEFVINSEAAFSREHTQWVARKTE